MKRFTKATAATVACLALVMGGALPATAADQTDDIQNKAEATFGKLESSANPEAVYASLPAVEKETFLDYYAPVDTVETLVLAPQDEVADLVSERSGAPTTEAQLARAGGCWAGYAKATARNSLGGGIYDVYVEGSWCSNGSLVTSTRFDRTWSTIGVPGWRDEGQIGSGKGVAGGQARIRGQRLMKLGSGGWDVMENRACVRLNGSRTGSASTSVTCSIY